MSVNIKIETSAAQFKNKALEYFKYHDISYKTSHWLVCCVYVFVLYIIYSCRLIVEQYGRATNSLLIATHAIVVGVFLYL